VSTHLTRGLAIAVSTALVVALVMAAVPGVGSVAGAQGVTGGSKSGGKRTLTVIGAYNTAGEDSFSGPHLDDGARLAVADLERKGWTVRYERIPASAAAVAPTEAALATAVGAKPDLFVGLITNAAFLALGAKVAASDVPTFALASPVEGLRTGVAGGDNLYLLRPLDAQLYGALTEYACDTLRLRRLGISVADSAFGAQVRRVVEEGVEDHPTCKVATVQTSAEGTLDVTPQLTAFRDAGVDGIISANSAGTTAAQVNQLRLAGDTTPFLGGVYLQLAKVSNAIISDLENLVVVEDCVPSLAKSEAARAFTEAYRAEYGYTPNPASAQIYDAFHLAANALEQAGSHDAGKINKAMAKARYRGVCAYANNGSNALASSATLYGYHADGSRRRLAEVRLAPVDAKALTTPT
jgi:branched-chain amino acid transport system substrate-binding protein